MVKYRRYVTSFVLKLLHAPLSVFGARGKFSDHEITGITSIVLRHSTVK